MNVSFYSVSCSLYHPWLRYSWTHSFIHTAGLSPLITYIHRLRVCKCINISIMRTGVTVFLPSLRREAVILMWRAYHRRPLPWETITEYRITVADWLPWSNIQQRGYFCICTQRESWISHLARSKAWRGYVYIRVRWEKGALPRWPFLVGECFSPA